MPISSLLLLSLCAAQEPAQEPPPQEPPIEGLPETPTPRGAMLPHDFVIGMAGNEVVLRGDLEILIQRDDDLRTAYEAARTDEEVRDVLGRALSRRLETLILVQAGQDLGYDPELVEELTTREFEQQVERAGGHRNMSRALQRFDRTPESQRDQTRDRLLQQSFVASKIGRAAGPTGRVSVDRHVRPGLMRMYYDSFVDSNVQRELEVVGKQPERVRLQALQVNLPAGGDPEQSREQVEAFLEFYRSEDVKFESEQAKFEYLIERHGDEDSRKYGGMIPVGPPRALAEWGRRRHEGSEALGRLAREGEVGDTTEPLWLEEGGEGGTRAWCIYRLAERLDPVPARPFQDQELQADLRRFLLHQQDRERENAAFLEALRDTYLQPPDARRLVLETRGREQ